MSDAEHDDTNEPLVKLEDDEVLVDVHQQQQRANVVSSTLHRRRKVNGHMQSREVAESSSAYGVADEEGRYYDAKSQDLMSRLTLEDSRRLQQMLDEQYDNGRQETEKKYESYHSIIYYFYVIFALLGLCGLTVLFFVRGLDQRFELHRGFVGLFVLPVYVMCTVVMFLTRRNYFLNNASTHFFSVVFGYALGFVTFVLFGSFIQSVNRSALGSGAQ